MTLRVKRSSKNKLDVKVELDHLDILNLTDRQPIFEQIKVGKLMLKVYLTNSK